MEKLKNEKILKYGLSILLILLPFLNCYILYKEEVVKFFHFSPTTIIITGTIGILFILAFCFHSTKKERKLLFGYGALVIAYTALHHFSCNGFDNSKLPTFIYGTFQELLYIVRMILPFLTAFLVYKINWDRKDLERIILIVVSVLSGVIIISNLLKISLTSYGGDNIIQGSIFTWFTKNSGGIQAEYLASRGWFYMANQISALFCLLLPLTFYFMTTKFHYGKVIIFASQILAMMMIGTRVASFGWVAIVMGMLFIYLFCTLFMKQQKFQKKCLFSIIIVSAFGIIVLLHSPVLNRTYESDYFEQEKNMKEEYEIKHKPKESQKTGGLYQDLSISMINPAYYIQLYPYKQYSNFWKKVVKLPFYERGGNRDLQLLVTKDVWKKDPNILHDLFGIGYSRMMNGGIYIERDFIVHYYTIGMIGILILLCPYLFMILVSGKRIIKNYKQGLNYFSVTLMSSTFLALFVSIFSGHVMDEWIVTLFLGLILGLALKRKQVNFNEEN